MSIRSKLEKARLSIVDANIPLGRESANRYNYSMELANEYWRRQLGCKTEAKNQTLAQMSYDQLFEDLKNLRAQLENDKKKLTPVVRKLKLIDFLLKHVFVK